MNAPATYFDSPERLAVLHAELLSWIGTPFAPRATVKGVGVDCVTLCGEVMCALGVIEGYTFPPYSIDYAKHRSHSLVLEWLDASPRFARVPAGEAPLPGDVACFRLGRCVHHCALMLNAVRMVHPLERGRVVQSQVDDGTWADHLFGFYRPLPL